MLSAIGSVLVLWLCVAAVAALALGEFIHAADTAQDDAPLNSSSTERTPN